MARAVMFQGTGSSVGKSTLVAGLARALTLRGLRVRPFKPQNMSNNAAVTTEGGEIGRAQALQARACKIPASVHMNPILLKPQSDTGAQIIVQGRIFGTAGARDYQAIKPRLLASVLDSFARLKSEADIVLVEGAGSASEINLRANDLANMGFARATDTPVVLIGDIDRGGVIASLVGTHTVLDPADAALIAGFIVNRMRGDLTLFAEGMRSIAAHTGWRPLGLVPHFDAVRNLPAEDAADLATRPARRNPGAALKIAVPRLPCIANFDDFDPLAAEPEVDLQFIAPGTPIPTDTDLIILAGSKATIADLATLRAEGWDIDIRAHHRHGGAILGLCGGYQMLGRCISDPDGIEGIPGSVPGLGLLEIDTIIAGDKRLTAVSGRMADGARFRGFEMHIGRTTGRDCADPLLHRDDGSQDGAQSPDRRVSGTYIHGLFASETARASLLRRFGATPAHRHHDAEIEATLDALAAHCERHIAIDTLLTLAR